MHQDPQLLVDDTLHAWSQRKSNPHAPLRETTVQVANDRLDALDKISLKRPKREMMRLLDEGVPVFLWRPY